MFFQIEVYIIASTIIILYCLPSLLYYTRSDLENQESILFTGQWSTKGCNTSFTSESTMCQCDHLTHFAILLSARPLDLSREQTLVLQITGYIGVSVSLIAMAATVFVFIFLR